MDFTLGADIENLIATGTVGQILTGNELGNGITGTAGDDVLAGGGGNDTLTGGLGSDTFVFAAGITNNNSTHTNFDTIADYQAGTDKIDLTGVDNFNSYQDVHNAMSVSGNGVLITASATDHLTIQNTTIATLDAKFGDFLLHG